LTQEHSVPAIFELDTIGTLPLFGQALLAARMARRGVLAVLPEATHAGDAERALMIRACDGMERCAREGSGTHRMKPLFAEAMELRYLGGPLARERDSVRHALWWALDAKRAAEMAQDFPMDSTVTRSMHGAVSALAEDRRITRLEITILLAGDFDLVRFACGEAGIGRYDGLTGYVMERLTPVHALTLNPVRPTPEEESR
jgi:hypothetical protein